MAFVLRASVVLVPLLTSFFSSVALARLVPRPHGIWLSILWWVGLLALSTVVLVVTERLARRVLPLAALMKLSLVFPDQAPSRFSFALRSGTTRQLRKRLDEYKLDGSAAARREWICSPSSPR